MLKLTWIVVGVIMIVAGLVVGKATANRHWAVVIPGFMVSAVLVLAGIMTTFVGLAS